MNEDYLFEGSLLRILDDIFDYNDTIELLKVSDIGETELEYESLKPYDFILTYGDESFSLTTSEKDYIRYIYNCYSLISNENIRIFVIDLNLIFEKPYVECAAIIKVFNLLFSDKDNLFLFIAKGKIALGSKRMFKGEIKNNFCISNFYSYDSVGQAFDFFNSCCEEPQDYADNILMNSEIEDKYTNYDSVQFNQSYNEILRGIMDSIVIHYDKEYRNEEIGYIYSESVENELLLTYESISRELKNIGECRETKSAFQLLQEAEQYAMYNSVQQIDSDGSYSAETNEASDADVILKQILDGNKEN